MASRWMALVICSSCMLGLATEARADLREMAERFSRMGKDAMNNRDWVECIENFNQVIDIDPENVDAYLDKAFCEQEMKQYAGAAQTYREALQHADGDRETEIRMNLAWSLASSGNLADAESEYRTVCNRIPGDKTCWVALAHVLKTQEKASEAIMAYEKALEIDPIDTDLLKNVGELCMQNGMEEQAVSIYERWAEVEPDNVDPLRQLGYLLYRMGACDRGAKVFDKVLAVDQSNPGDYLNAGMLYQKCGKLDKASAMFEKYRELRPNDSAIDCRLLSLKEDTGAALEGIKLAEDAIKRFPNDPCILLYYGRLLDLRGNQLQEQKRFDEAIQRFQEGMGKFQKVLGDPQYGGQAQKQIARMEQLIIRAEKMKQREEEGY